MPQNTFCRLCLATNVPHRSFFDESDQPSEVYKITVKYFHRKILQPKEEYNSSVICLECWHHITDFHTFQQTVLKAQSTLELNKKTIIIDKFKEGTKIVQVKCEPNVVQIDEVSNNSIQLPPLDVAGVKDNAIKNSIDVFKSDECGICFLNSQFKQHHTQDNVACRCKSQISIGVTEKPITGQLISIKKKLPEDSSLVSNEKDKTSDTVIHTIDKTSFKRKFVETASSNIKLSNTPELWQKSSESSKQNETNNCTFLAKNPPAPAKWKGELQCVICNKVFENCTLIKQHFHTEHPDKESHILCSEQDLTNRFKIMAHLLKTKYVKLHFRDIPSTATNQITPKSELNFDQVTTNSSVVKPIFRIVEHDEANTKTNEKVLSLIDLSSPASKFQTDDKHIGQNSVISSTLRNSYITQYKRVTHFSRDYRKNDAFIAKWKSRLECVICKETCSKYSFLKLHFEVKHPYLQCYIVCCNFELKGISSIFQHISKYHQKTPQTSRCRWLNPYRYRCKICNIVVASKSSLSRHHRDMHSGNNSKPYWICYLCNKLFKYHQSYEKHKQIKHYKKNSNNAKKFNETFDRSLEESNVTTIKQEVFLKNDNETYSNQYQLNNEILSYKNDNGIQKEEHQHKITKMKVVPLKSLVSHYEIQMPPLDIVDIKNEFIPTSDSEDTNNNDFKVKSSILRKNIRSSKNIGNFYFNNFYNIETQPHDPDAFKCQLCDMIFTGESLLITYRAHMKAVHKKDSQSKQNYHLLKQETVHLKPKNKNSPNTFKEKRTNEPDAYIAKWMPVLNCVLCPETCESFVLLKKHFRLVHPGQACYISCCGRKLKRRYLIIEHFRIWHENCPVTLKKQTKKGTQIKENYQLMKHEAVHLKPKSKKPSNTFKVKRTNEQDLYIAKWMPVLNCVLCPDTCLSFVLLRKHFRLKHTGQACYISCCGKQLKRRYQIIKHFRKFHENYENYPLTIKTQTTKDSQFKQNYQLMNHEAVHLKPKTKNIPNSFKVKRTNEFDGYIAK